MPLPTGSKTRRHTRKAQHICWPIPDRASTRAHRSIGSAHEEATIAWPSSMLNDVKIDDAAQFSVIDGCYCCYCLRERIKIFISSIFQRSRQ